MSFPQFLPPPFPYNKWSLGTLWFFYTLVLPHQMRKWYYREMKPALCSHKGKTYVDADWTYTKRKCSRCHKTLRDLRKDPE